LVAFFLVLLGCGFVVFFFEGVVFLVVFGLACFWAGLGLVLWLVSLLVFCLCSFYFFVWCFFFLFFFLGGLRSGVVVFGSLVLLVWVGF